MCCKVSNKSKELFVNSVTILLQFICVKARGPFLFGEDKHVRLDGDDESVSMLSLSCAVRFLVCILTFGLLFLAVFFLGGVSYPYFDSRHIFFPRKNN